MLAEQQLRVKPKTVQGMRPLHSVTTVSPAYRTVVQGKTENSKDGEPYTVL